MKAVFNKTIKLLSMQNHNKAISRFNNAAFASELKGLNKIHHPEKNISIHSRNIDSFSHEISKLLGSDFKLKSTGIRSKILSDLSSELNANKLNVPALLNDVGKLLEVFEEISSVQSFSLGLFIVKTNMCSRFHSDINDLRLLCTYRGKGTYWLPDEAVNHQAHSNGDSNEHIVNNPKLIQQARTGDVLILKGALYPEGNAVIHRSPGVGGEKEKRLLLRIDTNAFGFNL